MYVVIFIFSLLSVSYNYTYNDCLKKELSNLSNKNNTQLRYPFFQVYLVSGKKCLAKAKTGLARRTLDPLFQQQLTFQVLKSTQEHKVSGDQYCTWKNLF